MFHSSSKYLSLTIWINWETQITPPQTQTHLIAVRCFFFLFKIFSITITEIYSLINRMHFKFNLHRTKNLVHSLRLKKKRFAIWFFIYYKCMNYPLSNAAKEQAKRTMKNLPFVCLPLFLNFLFYIRLSQLTVLW